MNENFGLMCVPHGVGVPRERTDNQFNNLIIFE